MSNQALQSIHDASLLYGYWTALGYSKKSFLCNTPLPQKIKKQIHRRSYSLSPKLIHSHPLREIARLCSQALKISPLISHEKGICCIDKVFKSHDKFVSKAIKRASKRLKAIYGYEDSCHASFEAAHTKNIHCIYELPIAYWETSQRLLKEEAKRYPQWESTLVGTRDSQSKNQRKTEEISLANTIICPSNFVKNSIPESLKANKTIHVVPYGAPSIKLEKQETRQSNPRLRILFVGSLTQRKGLADLFQAMKIANRNDIELVVLGSLLKPLSFYKSEYPDFTYHSPRPHHEVLQLMRSCDALALPSIVEGRANVQLEALACALPLIITPNTGGDDLIKEGQTGFCVPIKNPEAIAEKINWLADNRAELPHMQKRCMQMAQRQSWEIYRQRMTLIIENITR